MFMELNRVKEDIHHIKSKTGIPNHQPGPNNDISSGPVRMMPTGIG